MMTSLSFEQRHQLLLATDEPLSLGTVVVPFNYLQRRRFYMPARCNPLLYFLLAHTSMTLLPSMASNASLIS